MSNDRAKQKLDKYVSLRGDIAHRGAAPASVRRNNVTDLLGHVEKLVEITGDFVNGQVQQTTDVPLW